MAVKAGDLLFIKNQHEPMDEAIAAATGSYVHVGIAVDAQTVIHASPRYGVAVQGLAQFQAEFGRPDVYRPQIDDVTDIIARAKTYVGQPYNATFYPDGDGLYCSQLVEVAFGELIRFAPQLLRFHDATHEISAYWQGYYDKLGVAVPVGQPGSNPEAMAKSPQLTFIGTL